MRYWGGTGTNARYLCKGDYDDGGQSSGSYPSIGHFYFARLGHSHFAATMPGIALTPFRQV